MTDNDRIAGSSVSECGHWLSLNEDSRLAFVA
jgi:hypothetical protein